MKGFLITLLCVSICLAQDSITSATEAPTTASPTTDSSVTSEATTQPITSPAATVYTPAFGLNVVLPLVTTTLGAAILLDH